MSDISPLVLAVIFAAAFSVAVVFTWLVRQAALRFGYASVPRADRWSKRKVALLGGVGIAAAFFATVAILPIALGAETVLGWIVQPKIFALLAGAALMCVLGLVDDLFPLKPSTKMIGQIACAALLIGFDLRLSWTGFEILDVLLTFFWIIGITNAFNLLDNMDGLSAGTGVIAALCYTAIFSAHGEPGSVLLALVLAAAIGGFLVFNFNPASIFMGDSGSLFIGFTLAGLTLLETSATGADLLAVVAVPTLLLAIPIFDTSLVTVVRKLSGRAISQGGRDHTSHRLVALGLSERRAVLLLWGLSAAAGGVAFVATQRELPMGHLLLPVFVLGLAFLGVYLARVEVYEGREAHEAGLTGRVTPILNDLMYKRRIVEVAMDLVLVVFAYYASFTLRFEQSPLDANLPTFTESLPVVVACKMIALFTFGAYRGLWRYTGLSELMAYAKASAGGSVLSVLAIVALFRFEGYSRSLFVIDALLLFVALSASRLSFRLIDTLVQRQATVGRAAIIYGAGDGGQVALRELLNNDELGLAPVGFIDDDPGKCRRMIHGYPVYGELSQLAAVIDRHNVEVVILSSDKIDTGRLDRLAGLCVERNVEMRRLKMRIETLDLAEPPAHASWQFEQEIQSNARTVGARPTSR
jgi:UDP-GlcNAc:undecaprenyl-phosphate GlcNAc-1-phosphate transferase